MASALHSMLKSRHSTRWSRLYIDLAFKLDAPDTQITVDVRHYLNC